ncbi:MAG: Crp/Fnr family transcriptional regulator [Pseudomonadota bacterium]|nr:Crp/Fnr family transcriptional regulator [Pseudomonadota bacterium]
MAQSSCLVEKLGRFLSLSEADTALIAELEKDEQSFKAHTKIRPLGWKAEHLCVVKEGWLYSYRLLPEGRRQVLDVHYPGDVLGMADLPFREYSIAVETATDCCLCPFPKSAMDRIFTQSPRMTALLFTIALVEQTVLLDRLCALGRMEARERIVYLLLEVQARLRLAGCLDRNRFELPLTQTVIGDMLGLTNVYVSRMFSELEDDGLIDRDNGAFLLKEPDQMKTMVDFKDRYAALDTGWFPI